MVSRAFGKRTSRGSSSHTGTAPSRSNIQVTALSLLADDLAETFGTKFKNKTVVKQYAYSPLLAGRMHIPEIVERINFQGIDVFLDCTTEYNEDLVKLFYTGVDGKFVGFKFACNIGNRVIEVNDDVWKSLFEISHYCLLMISRLPILCLLQTMSLGMP